MGISAAIFVGGSILSSREAKKREKRTRAAQEQQTQVETANRAAEASRARRTQVREARRKQADIENIAATSGQTGSSAAIAAKGSIAASLGSNVGDIQTSLAEGSAVSRAQQDVFDADKKSDLERIAGISTSVSGRFI